MKILIYHSTLKISFHSLLPLLLLYPLTATALEYDFYGSVRVHGESVNPDNDNQLDSYTGFRDAYSRLGFNARHALSNDLEIFAKLELPLDVPNKAVQDPWDQDEDIRVGKIGLKGAFGNISYGQMWMPYYNSIAYPVDMFSSYYSGFATFTSFRKSDTVAYYSPSFSGISGSIGFSSENGAAEANGDSDDRLQVAASYNTGGLTLALGMDDLGGVNDARILGASLAWQINDAIYLGAKYEEHSSDVDNGYGADGETAINIYGSYTVGRHTIKAMLAEVDNYGESITHIGWDVQYRDDLKFFAEYYSEEETSSITEEHGGLLETCWSCSGGDVIAAGLRYDFKSR